LSAPATALAADDDLRSFLPDCVVYEVPSASDRDFRLFYQGPNTFALYGGALEGKCLSEHVARSYRDGILESYRAVVRTVRPFFSVRTTRDAANTPVMIETLRLPFAAGRVPQITHILTHFHAISIEGHFAAKGLHQDGGSCHYTIEALIGSPDAGATPQC
jgi:hypothetical protein